MPERLLFRWLCLMAATTSVWPATSEATIASIRLACDDIDAYVESHRDEGRIFADVSSGATPGPEDWRAFETEDKRAAADSGDNLNQNASVWIRNESVLFVSAMYQSPSRDWAHYVSHYLDARGRLLRAVSDLRTFYGRVRAVRDMFFTPDGQLIHQDETFYTLGSDTPLRERPQFMDQEPELYHSISEMPFLSLLRTEGLLKQDQKGDNGG